MPIAVYALQAAEKRQPIEVKDYTNTTSEEDRYYATFYMGAPPDTTADTMTGMSRDKSLPQAYLVEQPPGATVPPHFHDTDQFQVFVGGEASFGKSTLEPVSVHFAGGHTPYGPIVTRERGTHYFTLRVAWDGGGKPMPASRDLLVRGRACHRLAEDVHSATPAPGQGAEVIPFEANGLGAAVFALGAEEDVTLSAPCNGGGQFALVTEGTVVFDDAPYGARSCIFRGPDEAELKVRGGDAGGRVLLLQFPETKE